MGDTRKQLLRQRASLDTRMVRRLSRRFAHQFWHLRETRRLRNLAIYHGVGGEISCESIMREAWQRGIRVFLPVLDGNRLRFARMEANTPQILNRFRIPEPACPRAQLLNPADLDLVVVPLVAFDNRGNRLGMGAGFYDRSFSYLKARNRWFKPFLAGAAYDFQRQEQVEAKSWDIPLHAVVTETGITRTR